MQIQDSVVMVTGASDDGGMKLIEELLRRGARKIYAGSATLAHAGGWPDNVQNLDVNITDPHQVREAARIADDVTLLINNIGLNKPPIAFASTDPKSGPYQAMDINYFGTLGVCLAFAPTLIRHRGSIINVLSFLAYSDQMTSGSSCIEKIPGMLLTQALQSELKNKGVNVVGVLPRNMRPQSRSSTAYHDLLSPEVIAESIIDAAEKGSNHFYRTLLVPSKVSGIATHN